MNEKDPEDRLQEKIDAYYEEFRKHFEDIAWFDTNTTSDFATRMTEDLNKVQDGMGEKVGMMLRFIFAGLTAFIYPFIANWLLSLVLLSLVPILAVMGGVMGKERFQYKEKM